MHILFVLSVIHVGVIERLKVVFNVLLPDLCADQSRVIVGAAL